MDHLVLLGGDAGRAEDAAECGAEEDRRRRGGQFESLGGDRAQHEQDERVGEHHRVEADDAVLARVLGARGVEVEEEAAGGVEGEAHCVDCVCELQAAP